MYSTGSTLEANQLWILYKNDWYRAWKIDKQKIRAGNGGNEKNKEMNDKEKRQIDREGKQTNR